MAYTKKLTDQQWEELTDNVYWLDLNQDVETVILELIDKWLERNTATWWYRRDGSKFYLMGDKGTRTALTLWIKSGVFENQSGALEE
jgi:hypothetical protein